MIEVHTQDPLWDPDSEWESRTIHYRRTEPDGLWSNPHTYFLAALFLFMCAASGAC
jgi:hypothetical protein